MTGSERYNLITKDDVCKLLGISLSTLDRIIADGDLPVYRVRGSCKFKLADIDAYLENCREEHERPPLPKPVKNRPSQKSSWADLPPTYYPGMKVV